MNAVKLIRALIKETLQSSLFYVMQIDARGVSTHVKKKDGSDWVGSITEAEKLAQKLNRKSLSQKMNLKYAVEPI